MTQPTAELLQAIKGLAEKATKGDLTTAQRHIKEEWVECPFCQGDGEVSATDYCNFDGVALGVQFYGIGNEFGAHEQLWSALISNLPTIIAALELKERVEDPETVDKVARATYAADTHDLNDHSCPKLDLSGTDLGKWYDENSAMPLSGPSFVRHYHVMARAAIQALKGPTNAG